MSEFDVKKFLESLGTEQLKSAQEVEKYFEAIFALPQAERNAVADELESSVLSTWVAPYKAAIREYGTAKIKKAAKQMDIKVSGEKVYGQEAIKGAQAIVQSFINVGKLKGDELSPMLKTFNDAAKKLTKEEYNSEDCIAKPTLAMVKAIAKSESPVKRVKNAIRGYIPLRFR